MTKWILKNTKREILIKKHWVKKYILLGMSYRDILDTDIACSTTIRRVFRDLGKGDLLPGSGGDNAKVKFNPFLKVSNDTMYWYGYLFGDGHITSRKYSVGLTSIDLEHLQKYIKYIGENLTIHKRKASQCYDVLFGNVEAHKWLKDRGFSVNKSYEGKLHYINSTVLRGLFDSDGSYSGNTSPYFLTNVPEVADQVNTYLNKVGIRSYKTKHSNDDTCINVRIPMADFVKFYNFLYRKSTIDNRLDRKYNKMRLTFEKKCSKLGGFRES